MAESSLRRTPRKGKLLAAAPSPTSIFDLLTLDSPASSVAITPGTTPLAAHSGGFRQVAQHSGQSGCQQHGATARQPPWQPAAGSSCSGALPPPCRAAPSAPGQAAAACVKHPWWQFRAAQGAAQAVAPAALATQPSGELPPLPRPASLSRQGSAQPHKATDIAVHAPNASEALTPELFTRRRGPARGSRRLRYDGKGGRDSGASSGADAAPSGQQPPAPLPMLQLERSNSSLSSDSFSAWRSDSASLRRSGSGVTSSDVQQGGSARSTDGGGGGAFELHRQRSSRGSIDLSRPKPLDRTSSLNEAKVLMATQLQRTDSMVSPQLFHFDDHFEFEEVIGRSSMSEVFRVRHKISREPFAVKRSRRKFASRAHRRRCLHEIQAVAGLPPHPNVVGQYRAWQQGGHFYIQMDLCEGGSLQQLLRQVEAEGCSGIGEAAAWQVAAEVAAGLAFLHAAGVLHLDVKPGNVFADGAGGLRLGDFGLAVLRHQWEWEEGDGDYVAPELLAAGSDSSPAADLFSLGATLYECVAGRKLPRSVAAEAAVGRLDASPRMRWLIAMLLRPDAAARPTAQEVAEEASAALAALEAQGSADAQHAQATPGAPPSPPGSDFAMHSPIAGLLARRRALTPATDDSMADSTPRAGMLTPFSLASAATPPSPVRSRRPPPGAEPASPATPCLRLALLGSAGATGISDGARHRTPGGGTTPNVAALSVGPGGGVSPGLADAGSPAMAGIWPSSMAPLKAPPTLSGWRPDPDAHPGSPAVASVSPMGRWPRRRFSFGMGADSPVSPMGSYSSSWMSAPESDSDATAQTPRAPGNPSRQHPFAAAAPLQPFATAAAAGAGVSRQEGGSVRWQQEEAEAPAAAGVRGASSNEWQQAASSQAGSPDGAAPMQQDDDATTAAPNPFERVARVPPGTPASVRRPSSVGTKRRLPRTSGASRRPLHAAPHEWPTEPAGSQSVRAADTMQSFGSMTL